MMMNDGYHWLKYPNFQPHPNSLITQVNAVNFDGVRYEVNQVEATDGLDMVNKLQPLQISRYFDKYVYRTKENVAMACYANDVNNNWRI